MMGITRSALAEWLIWLAYRLAPDIDTKHALLQVLQRKSETARA